MKKIIVLALTIALILTASVSAFAETEAKWHVSLPGLGSSLCYAPTHVAYELGFFSEEGIDAELITTDFEPTKIGLNNGTVATANGDFQYFPAIQEGIGMKIVDGLHQGCIKVEVLPESEVQGVEDLRGGKIGVDEIGGTPYQVALLWLAQAGIGPGEVEFLPFNDGTLELEALKQGVIDAAALWDPYASVVEKEGTARVLLDIGTDEPFAGHYCCFLYASEKVIEEQPELIAAILRAYHKAQQWIAENPAEAAELINATGHVSVEDHELAAHLLDAYAFPNHAHHQNVVDIRSDVEYFAQALYDVGYLTDDPATFAEKAYVEIDLTLGQE